MKTKNLGLQNILNTWVMAFVGGLSLEFEEAQACGWWEPDTMGRTPLLYSLL
jgi:hypothetical protein